MIMTMRESVYVRLLGNQYNFFLANGLVLLARGSHSPTFETVNTSAGLEHTSQPECQGILP